MGKFNLNTNIHWIRQFCHPSFTHSRIFEYLKHIEWKKWGRFFCIACTNIAGWLRLFRFSFLNVGLHFPPTLILRNQNEIKPTVTVWKSSLNVQQLCMNSTYLKVQYNDYIGASSHIKCLQFFRKTLLHVKGRNN